MLMNLIQNPESITCVHNEFTGEDAKSNHMQNSRFYHYSKWNN